MRDKKGDLLKNLRELAEAPDEQAAYAVQLLDQANGIEVVRTAVGVLKKNPRSALQELYWYYADNNGVRDPAAYTRSAILNALRQIMGVEDTELVVHAVSTYEFLPPMFTEEAALLRSTAIVLLAELDDVLTKFYATKLLADGYTEPMSGQPALTAVRVLAAMAELMPLYFYTCSQSGTLPEVTSECLRNLGDAPAAVITGLVKQYGESEDPAARVGLFELLLSGSTAPSHPEYLTNFLQSTCEQDLYRYLATIMATSTITDVRQLLAEATQGELDAQKVEILSDVLLFAPDSPELESMRRKLS